MFGRLDNVLGHVQVKVLHFKELLHLLGNVAHDVQLKLFAQLLLCMLIGFSLAHPILIVVKCVNEDAFALFKGRFCPFQKWLEIVFTVLSVAYFHDHYRNWKIGGP